MAFYDVLYEHKYKLLILLILIAMIAGYIYYKNYLFCEESKEYRPRKRSKRKLSEHISSVENSPSNSDKDFILDDLDVDEAITRIQKNESKLINQHDLTASEIDNINTKLNRV